MKKNHVLPNALKLLVITMLNAILMASTISCSDQQKIERLMNKYAKANIADYKSFEIISVDSIKDAISDLIKEDEMTELFDSYCFYYDSLTKLQTELDQINSFLKDAQHRMKTLQRKHDVGITGFISSGQSLFALALDPKYDYLNDISDNINLLKKKIDEAEIDKKAISEMTEVCIDSLWTLCYQAYNFCEVYSSKNIGKEAIVKCRLNDDNGYPKILSYDVIVNKRITSIISINEVMGKERYEAICGFVDFVMQTVPLQDK